MSLPTKAKVVIIGGGIHGLSTAWKLSETYKNPGDIVVLEKKDTAAGASGIACGVVRNNYFQPAMRELMAHSVSVWESDPKAFKYNPVGYLQISPEVMPLACQSSNIPFMYFMQSFSPSIKSDSYPIAFCCS